MTNTDITLFELLNRRVAVEDAIMPVITGANKTWWFWLLAAVAVAILMIRFGRFGLWFVLAAGITVAATNLVCDLLKHWISSPRPPALLASVHFPEGMGPLTSNGFPSAHAANMMALATISMLVFPRRAWLMLFLPIVVGYSRIYCGAHFPSQVLGGWGVGMAIGATAYLLISRNELAEHA